MGGEVNYRRQYGPWQELHPGPWWRSLWCWITRHDWCLTKWRTARWCRKCRKLDTRSLSARAAPDGPHEEPLPSFTHDELREHSDNLRAST